MSDWKKQNNGKTDERPMGEPHGECGRNFDRWRNIWENNNHFKKNIFDLKCTVIEFFKENGKEIVNKVYYPQFETMSKEKYPPFLDENNYLNKRPQAVPVCLQISFEDKKGDHCATITFHQSYEDFRRQVAWYLKCDIGY